MYMHTYLCKQICTHMNAYTRIYKICPHNHPNIYIQINIQAYTYMYTQLFLNFWFGAKSSRLLTCPPPNSTINKKTSRFNTENSSCAEVHNLVCTMDLPAAFYKVWVLLTIELQCVHRYRPWVSRNLIRYPTAMYRAMFALYKPHKYP